MNLRIQLALLIALAAMPFDLVAQEKKAGPLTVGFAISSFVSNSPSDARVAADIFLKHVFAEANRSYQGEAFELEEEFLTAIKNDEIDAFLINVELYLKHEKSLDARPILIAQRTEESPQETLVLITGSGNQFSSLKGTNLVIDNSARGELPQTWMSDYLLQAGSGKVADQFFAEIENVSSASRAVLPVYFGKQDAAIVSEASFDKMCEHNPNISERLHVICRSSPLVSSILCVRESLPQETRHDLVQVLGDLENSTDGKRFLSRIAAAKLSPFKPEYLYHAREVYQRTTTAKKKEERSAE